MTAVVKKFGGTSVASPNHIQSAAKHIAKSRQEGLRVAVVVSAMSGETDRLLALTKAFSESPNTFESDVVVSTGENISAALMVLALQALGLKARSFLGFQLPILTDNQPNRARIVQVDSTSLHACFDRGEIPVIAGFQGVDSSGRITTLGRGGSDTTAVAIAASLGGAVCEIYTDVDGVYTADPRLCPEAVHMPQVSYRFMAEAASLGAKVMHDRSVRIGMKYQVPILVKSTFQEGRVTQITSGSFPAHCVALDSRVSRVSVLTQESIEQVAEKMDALAVPCSMLRQNSDFEKVAIVPTDSLPILAGGLRDQVWFSDPDVAKVSVIGPEAEKLAGEVPFILSQMKSQGVLCQGVSLGDMSISFLMQKACAVQALQQLHAQLGVSECN